MDCECDEDCETELGVGVVGGVGDEAFREFVDGNGDGCLEAEGQEGVLWDMVVMGRLWLYCVRAWKWTSLVFIFSVVVCV